MTFVYIGARRFNALVPKQKNNLLVSLTPDATVIGPPITLLPTCLEAWGGDASMNFLKPWFLLHGWDWGGHC